MTGWIVGVADISVIRNAERSRDEILHFISHDMRSPQASILALIELQQYPASALPQNEFLSRIKKACHITLDLADNFVHLANAESQNYHLEITDFREMLLDACDEMWSVAKAKEIIINTDIPGDDYPVNVNRVLITRVLSNLLSNAVKYSPHNSTINASLKFKHDSANPHIVCTISDQGCGIARADQARLFQRFQRFTGESQPTNDGVGLAMLFIKAVLDRHNAQISFVSVPSEGTTFSITIPVSDAAELH